MVSPYLATTKDYHLPKPRRFRTPILQKEKAAILYLRRKFGYSMNIISKAFHRSLSLVHRILKFNTLIGNLRWMSNLRKIPPRVRTLAKIRMEKTLDRYLGMWMCWILGVGEKIP